VLCLDLFSVLNIESITSGVHLKFSKRLLFFVRIMVPAQQTVSVEIALVKSKMTWQI